MQKAAKIVRFTNLYCYVLSWNCATLFMA